MNEDLIEMSQYQVYQRYAYLTMDDIKDGLKGWLELKAKETAQDKFNK